MTVNSYCYRTGLFLLLGLSLHMGFLHHPVWAEEKTGEKKEGKVAEKLELEEITVSPTGIKEELKDFHGTVDIVTEQDIEDWKPLHSIDLLKRLPGLSAYDEDPAGLKPSIGIRGLNPSRSRGGVVLLVDGIPFNPGPYADPGAYYNVPIQRIERIEVIKGGSSILYGPNAVGGVVNYITKLPPGKPRFWTRQTFGDDALWVGEFSYGGTWEHVSGLIDFSRRQGDGFRDNSEFETNDFSTKWIYDVGTSSDVTLHFTYYGEDSETPRGISPAQFAQSVRNAGKQNDFFIGQRVSFDVTTNTRLTAVSNIRVLMYMNMFERFWHIERPSAFFGKNTLSAFKRRFNVFGVEPQYTLAHNLFNIPNDLITGIRLSAERENENRSENDNLTSRHGITFSTTEIEAIAAAWYIQNAFEVTDRWVVTPGIRIEGVRMSRDNNLTNANLNDLNVNGPQGGTVGREDYLTVLPGVGMTFDITQETILHGGIWRTASLPQFGSGAEAIDKVTGVVRDVDPEIGITYELGIRSTPFDWLAVDSTLFLLTYDDQIDRIGGVNDNFNDSQHYGLEGSLVVDFGALSRPMEGLSTYLNWTYLKAEFTKGPFDGNDTPLAPDVAVNGGIDYRYEINQSQFVSTGISFRYVGERFSDEENTQQENASGSKGELDSYTVWDARLSYHHQDAGLELFAGARNLFDEKYKLWRFGGGIIPGVDQTFYGGISKSF